MFIIIKFILYVQIFFDDYMQDEKKISDGDGDSDVKEYNPFFCFISLYHKNLLYNTETIIEKLVREEKKILQTCKISVS